MLMSGISFKTDPVAEEADCGVVCCLCVSLHHWIAEENVSMLAIVFVLYNCAHKGHMCVGETQELPHAAVLAVSPETTAAAWSRTEYHFIFIVGWCHIQTSTVCCSIVTAPHSGNHCSVALPDPSSNQVLTRAFLHHCVGAEMVIWDSCTYGGGGWLLCCSEFLISKLW